MPVTTYRIATGANQDQTGRQITQDLQTPVYAATIALTTSKQITQVFVGKLTGALTLSAGVTTPLIGDEMIVCFAADTTQRVVTLGTGFASSGTITVAVSKYASARFIFNGTVWVELSVVATA